MEIEIKRSSIYKMVSDGLIKYEKIKGVHSTSYTFYSMEGKYIGYDIVGQRNGFYPTTDEKGFWVGGFEYISGVIRCNADVIQNILNQMTDEKAI